MKSRIRRWRGYVALNGVDGALIWGSFRTTEAEARAFFERHNPMRGAVVVPVEIVLRAEDIPAEELADVEASQPFPLDSQS